MEKSAGRDLTDDEKKRLNVELGKLDTDNSETISFSEAEAVLNAAM